MVLYIAFQVMKFPARFKQEADPSDNPLTSDVASQLLMTDYYAFPDSAV